MAHGRLVRPSRRAAGRRLRCRQAASGAAGPGDGQTARVRLHGRAGRPTTGPTPPTKRRRTWATRRRRAERRRAGGVPRASGHRADAARPGRRREARWRSGARERSRPSSAACCGSASPGSEPARANADGRPRAAGAAGPGCRPDRGARRPARPAPPQGRRRRGGRRARAAGGGADPGRSGRTGAAGLDRRGGRLPAGRRRCRGDALHRRSTPARRETDPAGAGAR